jgi:hypothetical protein
MKISRLLVLLNPALCLVAQLNSSVPDSADLATTARNCVPLPSIGGDKCEI